MKNWAKTITILSLLFLAACGGKDKRESVKSTNRNGRTTTTDSRITNGTGTISTNQERIDALVSVEGRPEDLIGRIGISGTSVTFKGYADVSTSGYSSGYIESAAIEIIIKDEWVVSKKQQPYVVPFSNLQEGRIVTNGNQDEVVITFYDSQYGQWLILEGIAPHSTTGNFTGRIYFDNESSGYETNGEVELGTFTIPVCSFFKCVK